MTKSLGDNAEVTLAINRLIGLHVPHGHPLTTHHSLFIGTCGWWYADWQGIVYPDLDRHDPLAFMARYFDALEINVSFFRDVNAAMAASWLRRVEHFRGFQFTAKLHQRFTHERRDSFPAQEVTSSLAGLEPLREAGRLGALLAQFPVLGKFARAPKHERQGKLFL